LSEHSSSSATAEAPHRAGAFDVRNFIGALLGIYGVILLVTGLFFTSDAAKSKADGVNVNLWTGIALIVVSAFFITWARLKPVVVPAEVEHDDRPPAH
jgi:uncharacterized membrane protein